MKLKNLCKRQKLPPTIVLEYCQDIGLISDNCYDLDHIEISSADKAFRFIISNWADFSAFCSPRKKFIQTYKDKLHKGDAHTGFAG